VQIDQHVHAALARCPREPHQVIDVRGVDRAARGLHRLPRHHQAEHVPAQLGPAIERAGVVDAAKRRDLVAAGEVGAAQDHAAAESVAQCPCLCGERTREEHGPW
jgi:hypothetical protein